MRPIASDASWRIRGRDWTFAERGMIMGVLNITPDSFSDGGKFFDLDRAVEHGLRLLAEGADILDVGGESTRPGASPVAVDEELRRVIPLIAKLRQATDALISVDTMKAEVAREAVRAGADIINDVSGFRDPEMVAVAQQCEAALVVMHMQGVPSTMQAAPHYDDVVAEVRAFFDEQLKRFAAASIVQERIAFDPGFCFGKTLEHNVALLNAIETLRGAGRPLVVGLSRKSLLGKLLGDTRMESRYWPNIALTAWLRDAGVEVVRVHDVKANAEALHMMDAIKGRAA